MSSTNQPSFVGYHERLWPGPLGWFFVAGAGAFFVIALLPVQPSVAAVAGLLATALGAGVAVRTSTAVRVQDGELCVGPAHIPVALLGPGHELDRAGVRSALGPGSDARAFVCVRSWIPTAVELVVDDPADPTPTWLVSTRRPTELLAAVDAARRRPQAAHSEQIG